MKQSDTIPQSKKDELAQQAAEADCIKLREQNNDLINQLNDVSEIKKKLEEELQAMHKNGKKAAADAASIAEELRQEQEHSMHVERIRKGLEIQIKGMQIQLDETEAAAFAFKGGKKINVQLESRIGAIEQELDGEQRRHQETEKNWKKAENRIKEVELQLEEEKKVQERLKESIYKLQTNLKASQREIEEYGDEYIGKFKRLNIKLRDAEERADSAENALSKLRNNIRASASVFPNGVPLA